PAGGAAGRDPRGAAREGQGTPLPAGVPPAPLRVPAALQQHQEPPQRRAGPAQEEVARLAPVLEDERVAPDLRRSLGGRKGPAANLFADAIEGRLRGQGLLY